LTTTIKEELAKVVSSCQEALADQSRLEGHLADDFKAIDRFIKNLDVKRGNAALTVEDARDLALQLRQAVSWNQVNAQGTHLLFLMMLQISLLAQQNHDMKIDMSAHMEALSEWFGQWQKASSAWDKYIEEETESSA